jgi:hypothetical protein
MSAPYVDADIRGSGFEVGHQRHDLVVDRDGVDLIVVLQKPRSWTSSGGSWRV